MPEAFIAAQRAAEGGVMFVGRGTDLRPYELRIAALEGQVKGWEKGFNELAAVAKQSKDNAISNGILVDLFKGTLRELIAQGRITKNEALSAQAEAKKKLPVEDREILAQANARATTK